MKTIKDREHYNSLFDIYNLLLTEKQRNMFEDYYIKDYSICEIADLRKVTRQFVSLILKGVEKELENFEKKIGVSARKNKIMKTTENIIKKKLLEN